ncbi:hypothetical protein G4D82_08550 [Flavobacterium sp. CYK-4]|uniref:hypothetical protein n=1 Tax=Flavobacterium lotistagni TaxID=2709660 RepID=UPI001409D9F7|nr:hypothetical protein [Flavobacterium lotistagni]NHM07267.1 hypothetical protein [Flavobacterium lotistagni]
MKLKLSLIALTGFLSLSCSSNSPDDLQGEVPENISYEADIKPIIQSNCLGCHAEPPVNGAPMPLTDYDKVKQAIQSRGLIDRISRAQGTEGMMPSGGTRLPENIIATIIKWRDQDFQP